MGLRFCIFICSADRWISRLFNCDVTVVENQWRQSYPKL